MISVSPNIKELSRVEARKIINSMKSGTTPLEAVHYIDQGRQKWYKGMEYFLENAEAESSQVRFIRGRYGDGKTHLMSMAMYFALKRNFVVSYVSAEDTELHKFEQIYCSIIKNLQSNNVKNGIEQLLHDWKSRIHDDIPFTVKKFTNPSIEINFRIAIREFLKTENIKIEENIIQWLLGEKIKLPEIGLRTTLDPQNSRDMMRSLSILLREMGYSGLVVSIDELDRVQNQRPQTRQKVYQNLRLLLDNVDGQGGMKGTIFYLAAPSEMFTGEKGFKEYDALESRIQLKTLTTSTNQVDYRGVIINLEQTPLQKEDLYSMARSVRDIHALALEWDADAAVPDQKIEQIVNEIIEKQYNISTPRLVATTISRIVDMEQQGAKFNISKEIQKSNEICEQIREEKVKAKYQD